MVSTRLSAVAACGLLAGCASWTSEPAAPAALPRPQLSPDSVVLESVLLTFPLDRSSELEQIWRSVEEPLPPDQRRQLEENGFWCALAALQLPAELRRRLDEPTSEEPGGRDSPPGRAQHFQCRAGQRKVLLCAKPRPDVHLLVRDEQGSLTGRSFKNALCQMGLRARPLGDGSVRLQLTPEVMYGAARPRHIRDEGLWQVHVSQDRHVVDRLTSEVRLSAGQTLLLSCTPDKKGLGGQFFADEHGQRVLLVRVAQTQADNLFAPGRTPAPVVTDADP